MTDPTDPELLRTFAESGCETAFGALVARHSGLVYGAALRRTGDRALAEEAAQNTFAILARKASRLSRHPAPLAAWLHRTATFEAAKAARTETRHRRKMEALTQQAPAPAPPASPNPWTELRPVLDEALEALGEADRELVVLHHYAGITLAEIATATGRTAAAVQKQHQRALAKLAKRMRGAGASATTVAMLAAGLGAQLAAPAPGALVPALAQSALAAAPSLSFATLATHTVIAMSTPKLILATAAAVAVLSAVPLGLQQQAIARQRGRVAELEAGLLSARTVGEHAPGPDGVAAAAGPAGSGALPGSGPSGLDAIDLAALADDVQAARSGGDLDSMTRLMRAGVAIAALDDEDFGLLVERLAGLDTSDEKRALLLDFVVDGVRGDDPERALALVERFIGPSAGQARSHYQSVAATTLRELAARDARAAREWFRRAEGEGLFESKGIGGSSFQRRNAVGALFGGLMVSDPGAALEFLQTLDSGSRAEALEDAVDYVAHHGGEAPLVALAGILEDPADRRDVYGLVAKSRGAREGIGSETAGFIRSLALEPADVAHLVRRAGEGAAGRNGAPLDDVLAWVVEHSPPGTADANVGAVLGSRASARAGGSDPAFERLRAAGAPDALVVGYLEASQLDHRDPDRALELVAGLEDAGARAEAAARVAMIWTARDADRLATALARSGLTEEEAAAAIAAATR